MHVRIVLQKEEDTRSKWNGDILRPKIRPTPRGKTCLGQEITDRAQRFAPNFDISTLSQRRNNSFCNHQFATPRPGRWGGQETLRFFRGPCAPLQMPGFHRWWVSRVYRCEFAPCSPLMFPRCVFSLDKTEQGRRKNLQAATPWLQHHVVNINTMNRSS
jgi:hypothetical protein